MIQSRLKSAGIVLACAGLLSSCGAFENAGNNVEPTRIQGGPKRSTDGSILDIFRGADDSVKVNRYLWTASLQVLDFLPVEAADPFTGVISTGFGRPPGGGQPYRATILISDPALDARALNVALQSQRGPVDAATERAVEDAILNRARQLRIQAGRF
jgi:hypothetical protein